MSKNIIKATGIVLAVNLIVKLLGFLREMSIAWGFGASWMTDAYKVAYTLPYFFQSILGFALVTVVVPILTRYWVNEQYEEANLVSNSLIKMTAIAMAIVSAGGILLAKVLVFLMAPNLPPEAADLAIQMTRIMFPAVLFMSMGMVFTGILNSRYKFAAGAFAPGLSNIVIIASIFLFASSGIVSLAWGTLISFVAFFIFLFAATKRNGFNYNWKCDWKHSDVRSVFHNILPIALGVAVNQIYAAVNRIFASGLAEGSISALDYASKLMNLPVGIFVAAVATAIYPALAEKAIRKDHEGLAATTNRGLGLVGVVAIPCAIGLIVLRVPIVQLLFERGAFDAFDTGITAYALMFLAVGLLAVAANMILTRAYYAVNDVKTPVLMGVISIAVNVAASFIFIRYFQHGGLALANSAAAFVNTILLYNTLRKKMAYISAGPMLKALLKTLIASIIMGIIVWAIMHFSSGLGTGSIMLLGRVGISIIAGIICYWLIAKAFKIEEITAFSQMIRKKLRRT